MKNLEVLDGQHRLKACELLGLPVAYVVNIGGNSRQVALINNTQKSWLTNDYLKHYSHESWKNHVEYKKDNYVSKKKIKLSHTVLYVSTVRQF